MRTQLISKETILVNLLNLYISLCINVFFFFIILQVNNIIKSFRRYRNKSRPRSKAFCFCHRSLDCIAAYIKMSLLQVYNSIHKFDVICLSETYLDNSYHSDDDQLA